MKIFILSIFLLFSANISAQSVEVIGGMSKNIFFDYYQFVNVNYFPGSGHSFKIAFNGKKRRHFSNRFTIGYVQYGGEYNYSLGGFVGSGSTSITTAKVDKALVTFGFYPLEFRLWGKLDINIGGEASLMIRDSIEGTRVSINTFTGITTTDDLNSLYSRFNSKFSFGYRLRIAYDIKLIDKVYLAPQYAFYYGLTKEFSRSPRNTRIRRHFIGIGIEWKY